MLCGELLLGTGVRRFGWVPRHRASPHPPDSFAVSQPASRGANSPPKPGFGALAPATSSVALSTGCDRAHLWRSKTAERRLPFSGPGGAASGIALDPLGSPSLPCGRESRSPPGRVACPLRDRLPIQVEGPSDVNPPVRLARAGHSRVRFFLRGLCCPLQGLPPATFPFECLSVAGDRLVMKRRDPFFRFGPPAAAPGEASVPIRDCSRMFGLATLQNRSTGSA